MMTLNKGLKIRIYPNELQKIQILNTFGCCRFIYNSMLAERMGVYEKTKDNREELLKHKYKTEKQYKEEFPFLKDVDSAALQRSRIHLQFAYQNFFRKIKDPSVKEKGFPKFKTKKGKNSYFTNSNHIKIDFTKRKIKLPKMAWMSFRDKAILKNHKINSVTISMSKTGKFYASIQYVVDKPDPKIVDSKTKSPRIVGLDMSLTNFFVDDQGNSPLYTKLYRENENKLASIQSRIDKSTNRSKKEKLRLKWNRLYAHIANKRKDFVEKLSDRLTKEYDVIVVETLSLKDMAKFDGKMRLGKSVYDLGWGKFVRRLNEKAQERGKLIIHADRWFASSKTCNVCGFKKDDLELSDRMWTCPKCGTTHNRDQNAAINLKNYGIRFLTAGTAEFAEPEKGSESQTKIAE